MVTKGIIRTVPQSNEDNIYSVWLPFFDDPMEDAAEIVLDATLSEAAGINGGYSVGDVVYCAFEDNNNSRPVIVGKLSSPDVENTGGQINSEYLTISHQANLPHNTNVGDIALGDVLDNIISMNGDIVELQNNSGDLNNYVLKAGDTMTGTLTVPNVVTTKVGGTMGSSILPDSWAVFGGGNSGGYLKLATGKDGNEPIYVAQYNGAIDTTGLNIPAHQATLLDASGDTLFPGQLSAGSNITSGSTSDTTERQIKVSSEAGSLYMYSKPPVGLLKGGERGLWVPAHGTGFGKAIISIDTNNNASFAGNASSATNDSSGNTISTYYQKKITVSQSTPSGGSDGDIWIQY